MLQSKIQPNIPNLLALVNRFITYNLFPRLILFNCLNINIKIAIKLIFGWSIHICLKDYHFWLIANIYMHSGLSYIEKWKETVNFILIFFLAITIKFCHRDQFFQIRHIFLSNNSPLYIWFIKNIVKSFSIGIFWKSEPNPAFVKMSLSVQSKQEKSVDGGCTAISP